MSVLRHQKLSQMLDSQTGLQEMLLTRIFDLLEFVNINKHSYLEQNILL
jgi:hypothetical protein